ncbi:hypothetical protein M0813_06124 [Anaeramoeba flamelloides]|uniref:Uncharacterized protein n=1 Tax=Anaeramoeba flamelloides TaxID=1746091 RepID=A0ABQ8XEU6_9EUKA|nr:hypothetical protein M0813_06124 [Anaeramoeba flamelloides]
MSKKSFIDFKEKEIIPGVFLTDYRKITKNNNKKPEKKIKEITEENKKENKKENEKKIEIEIELEKENEKEKEIKTKKEKEKLRPLTLQPIKKRIVDPLDLQLIDSKFMDFKLNQLLTEIKMLISSNKQIKEFDPKGEDLDFVQAIKENEKIIVEKKKEYKELLELKQELTKSKIFLNKINPKTKPNPKRSSINTNNTNKKNINTETKKKTNQEIKNLSIEKK